MTTKCAGAGQVPDQFSHPNRHGYHRCGVCHGWTRLTKAGKFMSHKPFPSPSGTGIEALLSF